MTTVKVLKRPLGQVPIEEMPTEVAVRAVEESTVPKEIVMKCVPAETKAEAAKKGWSWREFAIGLAIGFFLCPRGERG